MSKLHVAVLCGGKSTEHNISLLSAKNILTAMDTDRYLPFVIYITKEGKWMCYNKLELTHADDANKVSITGIGKPCTLITEASSHRLLLGDQYQDTRPVDVLFPILHGMYGEDGAIQGLAKLAGLPCVGPGILGSAIGMDKEVMKRLLSEAGINSAPWRTVRARDMAQVNIDQIVRDLGERLFVKPVNLGSSVGISHVKHREDLLPAIQLALKYDTKVIIEQQLYGREIECAVMGNQEDVKASIPGEVIPKDGFYSYEAKYIDEVGTTLAAPAQLTDQEVRDIKDLAIDTFVLLECHGMARVDMFLTDDGLYINEINTLPGFTKISMYPTLWKLSGIEKSQLISELIQLSISKNLQLSSLLVE